MPSSWFTPDGGEEVVTSNSERELALQWHLADVGLAVCERWQSSLDDLMSHGLFWQLGSRDQMSCQACAFQGRIKFARELGVFLELVRAVRRLI